MNAELDRIKRDLARAKQRVAEIEAGQRGVRTGPFLDTDGDELGAGMAYNAQLQAQRAAVTRLEHELVQAMIPNPWGPAEIIARMSAPPPEPVIQVQTIKVDDTRRALEALLTGPDKFFSRTALKEILEL